jgi:hypothetical protein
MAAAAEAPEVGSLLLAAFIAILVALEGDACYRQA